MFNSEKYYLLGTLLRSHGVKGGIVLEIDLDVSIEDIKKLELVFVLIDNLPVPFFIKKIKTYTKNRFIVNFIDINDIDTAEALCINKVIIEKTQIPEYEQELSIEDLIGYTVIDSNNNVLGVIDEFLDINLNPTFKLVNDDSELLIPANENFIIEINEKDKTLFVEIPDGLLDLY